MTGNNSQSPPYTARGRRDTLEIETDDEGDTVVAQQRSPVYGVDEAIALTASKIVSP